MAIVLIFVIMAIMASAHTGVCKKTDRILSILEGNGNDGLVTKAALNEASITRAWSFIKGIVGYVLAGSIGLGFYMLKG